MRLTLIPIDVLTSVTSIISYAHPLDDSWSPTWDLFPAFSTLFYDYTYITKECFLGPKGFLVIKMSMWPALTHGLPLLNISLYVSPWLLWATPCITLPKFHNVFHVFTSYSHIQWIMIEGTILTAIYELKLQHWDIFYFQWFARQHWYLINIYLSSGSGL